MDSLPPYDSSGFSSPGDWLTANNHALFKLIDQAQHLDQVDKMECREFVERNAVYTVLIFDVFHGLYISTIRVSI
jgi:hypothetical protein